MYQNTNNLPALADRAENGPYPISLQQPPAVIQYQGPQVMQQFMATICACTAMEIQSMVFPQARNALRVFMFNLYSRNCFNNQQFHELVTMIADLAAVEHMGGRMPDIGNSLPALIMNVTETFAAAQVSTYPALIGYLDPSFESVVTGQMQQLQGFKNMIAQAQRGGQPQQQQQQWNQPQQQQSWGPQQGGQHWAAVGGYGGAQQVQTVQRTMVGVSPSGLFSAPAPSGPVGQAPSANSKYNRVYGEEAAAPAPVPILAAPAAEPVVNVNLKWSASDKQPYPPAYNPRKADVFLTQDQETNAVTASFVEKEPSMDYNRHQIPSVFGALPAHYTTAGAVSAQERIGRGLKTMEEEAQEAKTDPELPPVTIQRKLYMSNSLQELWGIGMIKRYRHMRNEELSSIFTFVGEVNRSFISMRNETDSIRKLSESLTYNELREKLLAMRASTITGELWTHCERMMTNFIAGRLKNNMSMAINIDSFCEDFPDLLTLLQKSKGDLMLSCFLKDQSKHIARIFKAIDPAIAKDIVADMLVDEGLEDHNTPCVSFISTRYSLTLINSTSFNMEVEFDKRVASGLTKTRTPELHKLATILFEETKNDDQISHHYIRSADGRTMELTRGAIGDNFYLISLVE